MKLITPLFLHFYFPFGLLSRNDVGDELNCLKLFFIIIFKKKFFIIIESKN